MVLYSTNMSVVLPPASQVFRTVPCFCGRMLVATRAMSRLYNEELRRAGMEGTQFGILQLIARLGPMTQNQLGDRLAAGETTVSRNLKLLQERGWVELAEGADRRLARGPRGAGGRGPGRGTRAAAAGRFQAPRRAARGWDGLRDARGPAAHLPA